MVDATAKFFADLESSGHQPLLEKASGSLRFEVGEGRTTERWRVDIGRGDVDVSHKAGAADCVLRAPKPLFDKIASGRENAMTAVLRGALIARSTAADIILDHHSNQVARGPEFSPSDRSKTGLKPAMTSPRILAE